MPAMDNAYALLVGIANYQNIRKLPHSVLNDAQDMRDVLVTERYGAYPAAQVVLLTDQKANKEALLRELAALALRSDPNSSVLIYFSGHGGRIRSGPYAGEYLLPVDVEAGSAAELAQTAVSGQTFSDALRAIPARKVVVLFDCCHAGGIGTPKDATAPEVNRLPETYYEILARGKGRAIISSSRSSEYSYVSREAPNSVFTHHLLAGLRGGIASDDGLIRIFDLFEYLQPRVTGQEPQQHPIFKAELEENFPVALYLGGAQTKRAEDEEGFRYDAYVSYVDQEPDVGWVWDTLVPRLEGVGLRLAVSGDVEQPGVSRVVNIERGIRQSKRTLLVLSPAYVSAGWAEFENVLAQTLDNQEGTYRLLPLIIGRIEGDRLPVRLSMLSSLDMTRPQRSGREFDRLIDALQGPLPRRQ